MRKAFTLVELLVVVIVLVILMSMTFRLGSFSSGQTARNVTINHLQRLENCLSGYYAAFGTYPPVHLYNSRDYTRRVSGGGAQDDEDSHESLHWDWCDTKTQTRKSDKESQKHELEDWDRVYAACKAQPMSCQFPYHKGYNKHIHDVSEEMKEIAEEAEDISEARREVLKDGFDDGVSQNIGRHDLEKTEWRDVKLFKFGLMSFLLPRYLVMMRGPEELYRTAQQWTVNNEMPCDPLDGNKFDGWGELWNMANSTDQSHAIRLSNIPSQAVCARWIANLEGICSCDDTMTLFGVKVKRGKSSAIETQASNYKYLEINTPGNFENTKNKSGRYVLNGVTVRDGWGSEFYYYSPAPNQSYVLWSAGANGRTFPPWVSRERLNDEANACVGYWVKDDIVGLKH